MALPTAEDSDRLEAAKKASREAWAALEAATKKLDAVMRNAKTDAERRLVEDSLRNLWRSVFETRGELNRILKELEGK